MAQNLHITFKAGRCDATERGASGEPRHIKPLSTPGYIYLFTEEDLLHFCWRPRNAPMSQPEVDLIMFGGDGSFRPYRQPGSKYRAAHDGAEPPADTKPTNGRVYVLSFSSSSDRHFFWLQSKAQSEDASEHSERDLKIADIVDRLLAGDDLNVSQELSDWSSSRRNGNDDGDGDTAMEDGDGHETGDGRPRGMSGGAGADATGGDIREEGEEAREGGGDGGRAAGRSAQEAPSGATNAALAGNPDAQAAISNFLNSLKGGSYAAQPTQTGESKPFASLSELLLPITTVPIFSNASEEQLDHLLALVPQTLIMLAAGDDIDDSVDAQNPDEETLEAVKMSLSAEQKKDIIVKVLRSPQFTQSLSSLTSALAEGGLPTLSEALKVPVEHGGYIPGGTVPLGGADALTAFVDGVRKQVEDEAQGEKPSGSDERMDMG